MPEINMKAKITEAFFSLSHKKNIDRITVTDLVTECKISRQTFYYHFRDILDVCEWSLQQEMPKILERTCEAESGPEAIRIFLDILRDNRRLIRRLHASDRRDQLERLLIRTLRDYLRELITRKAPDSKLSNRDFEFLLDFYSTALSEYMILHIDDETDAGVLANQLYRLMDGQMSLFG